MNTSLVLPRQFDRVRIPVAAYFVTTLLVLIGSVVGMCWFPVEPVESVAQAAEQVLNRWDSEWYQGIVTEGYSYRDATKAQNVAFFPSYPVLVKIVAMVSRVPNSWSGLFVAHLSLLLAFILFHEYLKARFPDEATVRHCALIAFAIVPSGFFWRFAYSESTFLLFSLAAFYLMHRRSSLYAIAFCVGLATATRPVGVALLLPFLWHVVHREQRMGARIQSLVKFAPLACWGIVAYMAYQYLEFGEPLAFVKTQQNWRMRPEVGFVDKAASYAALEPIWAVYYRHSYWYWDRLEPHNCPLLSLAFWNPVALVSSFGLVAVGWKRKWLLTEEALFAMGLMAIPYFTRAFDFCMLSQARFSSVVFPAYFTLGHLLKPAPRWLKYGMLAFATLLFVYFSARFAAGFRLI